MILTIFFWLGFILYILASVILILVVLVQSGKGGGLSGLVGSGSAIGDHLGTTGAEKTLTRWTTYCAIGFLALNIFLVLAGGKIFVAKSIAEQLPTTPAGQAAPAGQPIPVPPGQPAPAAPVPAPPGVPPIRREALPVQPVPAQPAAPAQAPAQPAAPAQ